VDALALGVVDAVLDGDEETLRAVLPALRDRRHAFARADASPAAQRALGALNALASAVSSALERLPTPATAAAVGDGTRAAAFLAALEGGDPVGSPRLRELLATDETQVSRTGRQLLGAGLVTRRKVARNVFWELTPRGRQALEAAGRGGGVPEPRPRVGVPRRPLSAPADPGSDVGWWLALLRDAGQVTHDTAIGADPERERILAAASGLHDRQGIVGTTWEQIAAEAGVPVTAVSRHFPAVEDLVPACGGLRMRQLQLPSPDEAAALFASLDPDARALALVQLIGRVHARDGGAAYEVLRREGDQLPVLGYARDALERSLDDLVAAALPDGADGPDAVAAVRALTDLDVWRAFERRGLGRDEIETALADAVAPRLAATAPARP
jgi:AcrR family transcriptional regulator/DNA-binding transcriptional ArsR family regulator